MNELFYKFFLLLFLFCSIGIPQNIYNKNAGACFRVDDNQEESNWIEYAAVFNNFGYKFTFAPNLGHVSSNNADVLRELQLMGHEMLDHTPDHNTRYFVVPDVEPYRGRPGIDHINEANKMICLAMGNINRNGYPKDGDPSEGRVNISGNTIISIQPGEFNDILNFIIDNKQSFFVRNYSMEVIYIPHLNKLFHVYAVFNKNKNDVDTIYVKSLWDEPVNLDPINNVEYDKLGFLDVQISIEALNLLAERTLELCNQFNLQRPYSWVQPASTPDPWVWRSDLKNSFGLNYGYTSGAVYPDEAYKCFNEVNTLYDRQFGMQWDDFREIDQPMPVIKNKIANNKAKHFMSVGISHFRNLLGGWSGYLDRMTQLLQWLKDKNIPVRTYSEWKEILYDTEQNPYCNVMPILEKDLDENGIPDGIGDGNEDNDVFVSGVSLDKNDGPTSDFNYSLSRNTSGYFIRMYNAGSIEKGKNSFSFWAKGAPGTIIYLTVVLKKYGSIIVKDLSFRFDIQSSNWSQYDTELIVPENCELFDIKLNTGTTSGIVKVGGFELRGEIIPPVLNPTTFNTNTKSVPLVWQDNSNNEAGFRVRRMLENENIWKTINGDLPKNSTSWIDNLLDFPDSLRHYDSITVYYEIQATAAGGEINIPSNIVSIKIGANEPLPVELSSFSAKYNNKIVILDWKTETEVNNYGFEIERRVGSIQSSAGNYEKIGFVQGHGNSNSPKKYSFKDKDLIGSNKFIYRLKQIDNDGQYSYSNTIEVVTTPDAFGLDQNYPNPFNPSTKIRYQLPEKSRVYLKVFNSLGQEVATLINEIKEPGNYEVDFDSSYLSSGVYYYRIAIHSDRMLAGDFISTKKMVLIK